MSRTDGVKRRIRKSFGKIDKIVETRILSIFRKYPTIGFYRKMFRPMNVRMRVYRGHSTAFSPSMILLGRPLWSL